MARFRPLTPLEHSNFIENRYQYLRAQRRGRIEYIALAFYGLIVPAASLFNDGFTRENIEVIIWTWGGLAFVATLIAAFAETAAERAARYQKWLHEYDREMQQERRFDERAAPERRAAYEKDLKRFQKDGDKP